MNNGSSMNLTALRMANRITIVGGSHVPCLKYPAAVVL